MVGIVEKLRRLLRGDSAARAPRDDSQAPDEDQAVRMHYPEAGPHANMGEHGAAHPDDDPEDLHHGRRRLKESHTSHWDLDYMSRDEMEELAKANRKSGDKDDQD
ncbi:MAG: hypothetical protein RH947_01970 [Alcanivorax sp.]|jgi:hypothetical protein